MMNWYHWMGIISAVILQCCIGIIVFNDFSACFHDWEYADETDGWRVRCKKCGTTDWSCVP